MNSPLLAPVRTGKKARLQVHPASSVPCADLTRPLHTVERAGPARRGMCPPRHGRGVPIPYDLYRTVLSALLPDTKEGRAARFPLRQSTLRSYV